MQIVAAAGEGALPTQVHLLRFGDSALEVFPEDAVHPVTSKGLRHRWNGGVGGVGPRVAAIAAVVAVAAAYLVLHCVLYLANSNKSRGALRFLAGAEARGGIHTGESCNVLEEEPPPASATSVATKLAESEGLDEEELLRQARKYVIDLTQFVEESENVILQLDTPLRSRCIAAFLCVAVVELSALYSLLEEPKREDMLQQTVKIRSRIQDVRDTLNTSEISSSRQRHHACLDKLLSRLNEVPPPSADLTQSQQLVKMKHLLQLQKLELDQLCTGLAWLKESLESSKSATNVSKAAATGGKGAAPNAKGVEAVAAPRGVSTDYILDSIVTSIEVTVHRRRGHVFLDQLLGGWLRKTHETISHYGIMSPGAIDGILRRPHKSHCEHMRTMETTPLASGEKPWENDLVQRTIAARKTPDKPVSQTPSKVCKGLRSEGRRNASRAPRKLAPRHHKPKATAGAAMSAPTSSSSTTSATAAITTSTAAAAPQQPGSPREGSQAVADPCGSSPTLSSPTMPVPDDAVVAVTTAVSERKDQPLSVSNRLETESPSAVSNELSPGWPPTPASLPQHPAASLPSGTAVSFSASGREPAAASTSTTPAATDVGISSGSSLSPETSPRPLASSFGAPAPTAAFSSQDFTLPTQGPAAPALLSHSHPRPSWAAVAARGVSPASSAFHPSPAAPAPPEAGFDRAPGASRPHPPANTSGAPHIYPIAPRAAELLASPRAVSNTVADAAGYPRISSSPTTSVFEAIAVAADTGESQKKKEQVLVSSRLAIGSLRAGPLDLPPGWPPTPASLPQHPAASLPSSIAVSFSGSGREPAAASTSTTPAATYVGISSGSSLSPETSPRPLASTFGAPAPTAAFSSQDFTLPTQGPAAPALLSHSHPRPSWAAVAARGVSPASSAFHPSPAAPAPPEAGFDRAPGASRPHPPANTSGAPHIYPIAPLAAELLASPRAVSNTVADAAGYPRTSSSPTTSVFEAIAVAADTGESQKKKEQVLVSSRLAIGSLRAGPLDLPPGWPPTPASLPQHPAASLPSSIAVSFSGSGREPAAASTSTTPAATDVGISSGSSLLPETSPRPLASSFGAPAPTAAFSSQDFTLPTQGPAAPALLSHSHPRPSWAAVAARGVSPASSAFHPLPAAPVLPEAGFDRAPGASRPRRSADKYVGPFGSPEPCATSSYAPLSASPTAAWQFQMKGLGGNTLQETDMPITGRTAAEAGLEALSQLFTGPPNRLPKWSNAP